jgi:hypothetical protein
MGKRRGKEVSKGAQLLAMLARLGGGGLLSFGKFWGDA